MAMTKGISPAQGMNAAHTLPPNRIWFQGAATPFIVHGHRHACLYRACMKARFPFIVLKICKKLFPKLALAFAYLWNNETQGRAGYA